MTAADGRDTGWEILVFVFGFFFDWVETSPVVLPVFGPPFQGLDFSAHVGPGGRIVFLSWFVVPRLLGMVLVLVFPNVALWLPRATGLVN